MSRYSARQHELEVDCPFCEDGTYLVPVDLSPPDGSVGYYGNAELDGPATKWGAHEAGCPGNDEVQAPMVFDEDALLERAWEEVFGGW